MTIRVGTIVTQFDSDEEYKSCSWYNREETDIYNVCVGIVTNADNPEQIVVKWITSCEEHDSTIFVSQRHEIDELWEIGQVD
jgi:hypothetical protein